MDSTLEEAISHVFKEPDLDENGHVTEKVEKFSHIYLIRLQLEKCMLGDPTAITWPIAMTVLAGIDALGLYWTGGKKIQNIDFYETTRESFKNFCKKYLHLKPEEQIALYQLRCAFLHTASLTAIEKGSHNKYEFTVNYEPDNLEFINIIHENTPEGKVIKCTINLNQLYSKFEAAIAEFRDYLMG